MSVLQRFLRYVAVETTSNPHSNTSPTTPQQLAFAHTLVAELKALGVQKVTLSKEGVVYAFLPATTKKKVPTVGFIAHMDTSFDCSGKDVIPRIITNYDGLPILLNEQKRIYSDPHKLPSLKKQIGKTLVVTDGTTLLGADNKAGIAAIMSLVEFLLKEPTKAHGAVHIAFTPDEEVGRGTDHFDIPYFACDFAYTVDGGSANEIEYENFHAASCVVDIQGLSTHPGAAKNVMINSQHLAFAFHQALPKELDPALTSGYEGFNHLTSMEGSVEKTRLNYIIRNHDITLFEKQKQQFVDIQQAMNKQYKQPLVSLTIKNTYANMRDIILQYPIVLELAKKAITNQGMIPKSSPIRGGTDGARLTYDNLPCPNLGTGGYHFHGPNEYLVVEELEMVVDVLKEIVDLIAKG